MATTLRRNATLEWMWADAGEFFSIELARKNPLRWDDCGPRPAKLVACLSGKREQRGVLLRVKGASGGWHFDTPHAAASWIRHNFVAELAAAQQVGPQAFGTGYAPMFGMTARTSEAQYGVPEGIPPAQKMLASECYWSGRARTNVGSGTDVPFRPCFARVEGRGIHAYARSENLREMLATISDVTNATITRGRAADDSHELQADDGDEMLEGDVQCQLGGKGNWHRFRARVTATHGLQLWNTHTGSGDQLFSSAQLPIRNVSPPKKDRSNHPFSLRIDLSQKDSNGYLKYTFDLRSHEERGRWLSGLKLRSSKHKLVITLPEDVESRAYDGVSATVLSARVLSHAFAFNTRDERDEFAQVLDSLAAGRLSYVASGETQDPANPQDFSPAPAGSVPAIRTMRAKHDDTGELKKCVEGQHQVWLAQVSLGCREWACEVTFRDLIPVWTQVISEIPPPWTRGGMLDDTRVVVQDALKTRGVKKRDQIEAQNKAAPILLENLKKIIFQSFGTSFDATGQHKCQTSRQMFLACIHTPVNEWFLYEKTSFEVKAWMMSKRGSETSQHQVLTHVLPMSNIDRTSSALNAGLGLRQSSVSWAMQNRQELHHMPARISQSQLPESSMMEPEPESLEPEPEPEGVYEQRVQFEWSNGRDQWIRYDPVSNAQLVKALHNKSQVVQLQLNGTNYTADLVRRVQYPDGQPRKTRKIRYSNVLGTESGVGFVTPCMKVELRTNSVSQTSSFPNATAAVPIFAFLDREFSGQFVLLLFDRSDHAMPCCKVLVDRVTVDGLTIQLPQLQIPAIPALSQLESPWILMCPTEMNIGSMKALEHQLKWADILSDMMKSDISSDLVHPRLPAVFCQNIDSAIPIADNIVGYIFGRLDICAQDSVRKTRHSFKELWRRWFADDMAAPLVKRLYQCFVTLAGPPLRQDAAPANEVEVLKDLQRNLTHSESEAQQAEQEVRRLTRLLQTNEDELQEAQRLEKQAEQKVQLARDHVAQMQTQYLGQLGTQHAPGVSSTVFTVLLSNINGQPAGNREVTVVAESLLELEYAVACVARVSADVQILVQDERSGEFIAPLSFLAFPRPPVRPKVQLVTGVSYYDRRQVPRMSATMPDTATSGRLDQAFMDHASAITRLHDQQEATHKAKNEQRRSREDWDQKDQQREDDALAVRKEEKRLEELAELRWGDQRTYAWHLCQFFEECAKDPVLRAFFAGFEFRLDSADAQTGRAALERFKAIFQHVLELVSSCRQSKLYLRDMLEFLRHRSECMPDEDLNTPFSSIEYVHSSEIRWVQEISFEKYIIPLHTTQPDVSSQCRDLGKIFNEDCKLFYSDQGNRNQMEQDRVAANEARVPEAISRHRSFKEAVIEVLFDTAERRTQYRRLWSCWLDDPGDDTDVMVNHLYTRFAALAGNPPKPIFRDAEQVRLEELSQRHKTARNKLQVETDIPSCAGAEVDQKLAQLQSEFQAAEQELSDTKAQQVAIESERSAHLHEYARQFCDFMYRCSSDVVCRCIFAAFEIKKYQSSQQASTDPASGIDEFRKQLEAMDDYELDKAASGHLAGELENYRERLDACDDEDDPHQAVVDLVLQVAQSKLSHMSAMDTVKSELQVLKISELNGRARQEGVAQECLTEVKRLPKLERQDALMQLILDAVCEKEVAAAEASGEDLVEAKAKLRGFKEVFNYISENSLHDRTTGWAEELLQKLEHPDMHNMPGKAGQGIRPVTSDETAWLDEVMSRQYSVLLQAEGDRQWDQLAKLFNADCIHFFLAQAVKVGDTSRLQDYLENLDFADPGRRYNVEKFVPYVFDLSGIQNKTQVLQQWHEADSLSNHAFESLATQAFQSGATMEVLLSCLVNVILLDEHTMDQSPLNEVPWILVQCLYKHKEAISTDVFFLFELVLRYARHDQPFNHLIGKLQSNRHINQYITQDFLNNFCSTYFRAVCVENQDLTMTRQNSVAQKGRDKDQISAAILGYIKVALFTAPDDSAGGHRSSRGLHFSQRQEQGLANVQHFLQVCELFIFDHLMAHGSQLLNDVVELLASDSQIPEETHLLPEVKRRLLTDGEAYRRLTPFDRDARAHDTAAIPRLWLTPDFFTPGVQSLVTRLGSAIQCAVPVEEQDYYDGVNVIMRLVKHGEPSEPTKSGLTLADRAKKMLNPVPEDPMRVRPLVRNILERLLRAQDADLKAPPDVHGTIAPALSVMDVGSCVQYAVKAQMQLEGSRTDAHELLEKCINYALDNGTPGTWKDALKKAEQLAYFIKYLYKEDLELAYKSFRDQNADSLIGNILDEVQLVAPTPLVDATQLEHLGSDAAEQKIIDDLLEPQPGDDETIQIMKEITGRFMGWMKERTGLPMTPHHTQMIAMLMFRTFYERKGNRHASVKDLKALVAEVGTGEGKSVIIAMLAVYMVKAHSKRVHILENNVALLKRDYEANKQFFALFTKRDGSEITFAEDFLGGDEDICYCVANTVDSYYMDSVTSNGDGLSDIIMIVDEVDDLVIDADPRTNYVLRDDELTEHVLDCFEALRDGGVHASMPAGCTHTLWQECQDAKRRVDGWVLNKDYKKYIKKGKEEFRMVDSRGCIRTNTVSLSLTYLNWSKGKTSYPVSKQTTSFVTCTPHIFNQYECIFGLTGSVGGEAERQYLLETYHAKIFAVPRFLSTCTGTDQKTLLQDDVRLYATESEQHSRAVALAQQMCEEVPVLIIMKSDKLVEQLFQTFDPRRVQKLLRYDPVSGADLGDQVEEITDLATKPVDETSVVKQWRITITDYFGGRGIDYSLSDKQANNLGGLMVIITDIPDSQREWVQWIGRTARQDKNGQISVLLNRQDEFLSQNEDLFSSGTKQNPDVIGDLMSKRNELVQEKLKGFQRSLETGSRLNALCEAVYRDGGGRSKGRWPGTAKERQLRDFLESGKDSESDVEHFKISLKLTPRQWEFENCDNKWEPFEARDQMKLTERYNACRDGRGPPQFELVLRIVWTIDLTNMTQKNNSTKKTQRIRGRDHTGPLRSLGTGEARAEPVRDRSVLDALQQCMETDPTKLSYGKDVRYPWPPESVIPKAKRVMKVAKAWRLHNSSLHRKYEAGRQSVEQHCKIARPEWRVAAGGMNQQLMQASAQLKLRPNNGINEVVLLTGVPKHVVEQVMSNGLNTRYAGANAGTMFGAGVYFAEDAGKCDQYTVSDEQYDPADSLHQKLFKDVSDFPDSEVFYIFVCTVAMGHCKLTKVYPGTNGMCGGGVFANRRRAELAKVPGQLFEYHSLLADLPTLRYREIVNFHEEYTLPQYLVAYTRSNRDDL